MKAYNLYETDQPNIPPGNDFKTPHIPKEEFDMKSANMNSDPIPNTTKNRSKLFPWGKVCVIGIVLFGIYLFLKIPPNDNYRRKRR